MNYSFKKQKYFFHRFFKLAAIISAKYFHIYKNLMLRILTDACLHDNHSTAGLNNYNNKKKWFLGLENGTHFCWSFDDLSLRLLICEADNVLHHKKSIFLPENIISNIHLYNVVDPHHFKAEIT